MKHKSKQTINHHRTGNKSKPKKLGMKLQKYITYVSLYPQSIIKLPIYLFIYGPKACIKKIQNIEHFHAGEGSRSLLSHLFSLINFKNVYKFLRLLISEGPSFTFIKTKSLVFDPSGMVSLNKQYLSWYKQNYPNPGTLLEQRVRLKKFAKIPLISILTPVYNTNHTYLKECIQSVIDQSYHNWELILVDDNSSDLDIWPLLQSFAKQDKRIKIKHRVTNGHICIASNDALKLAKGEWIALLDHDDVLWPNALYEVVKRVNEKPKTVFVYSDEDKIAEDGVTHCDPFFKPDWSPHFLWSCNYITHFAVLKTDLVKKIGGFREGTQGTQDWDLFLRAVDAVDGFSQHPWNQDCQIQHIDTMLYSWRKSETSTASEKHSLTAKDYAYAAQEKVLNEFFAHKSGATVTPTRYLGIYDVQPHIHGKPKVSIIIPTKNAVSLVKTLVESITSQTSYANYEIILVSNNSTSDSLIAYQQLVDAKGKVVEENSDFNFSKLCNVGAKAATGEYLLFVNNDVEITQPNWIEGLLAYAQLPEVGAVGPRLVYPNGRIQNNGLVFSKQVHKEIFSMGDFVAPYYRNYHPLQNFGIGTVLLSSIRDYSAITGAVLMIERSKFESVDEWNVKFEVAFNDLDLCLSLNRAGYLNVINPNVTLQHDESTSVGLPNSTRSNQIAYEEKTLQQKWMIQLSLDSFYSKRTHIDNGRISI